eukprot:COSAG02_NODE_1795_length_10906_cov_5.562084_7_plen_359_part_00
MMPPGGDVRAISKAAAFHGHRAELAARFLPSPPPPPHTHLHLFFSSPACILCVEHRAATRLRNGCPRSSAPPPLSQARQRCATVFKTVFPLHFARGKGGVGQWLEARACVPMGVRWSRPGAEVLGRVLSTRGWACASSLQSAFVAFLKGAHIGMPGGEEGADARYDGCAAELGRGAARSARIVSCSLSCQYPPAPPLRLSTHSAVLLCHFLNCSRARSWGRRSPETARQTRLRCCTAPPRWASFSRAASSFALTRVPVKASMLVRRIVAWPRLVSRVVLTDTVSSIHDHRLAVCQEGDRDQPVLARHHGRWRCGLHVLGTLPRHALQVRPPRTTALPCPPFLAPTPPARGGARVEGST